MPKKTPITHGVGAIDAPEPQPVDASGALIPTPIDHGVGAIETSATPVSNPFPTWYRDGASGYMKVADECLEQGCERIEVPGSFSSAKHGVYQYTLTDGRTMLRPDSYAGSDVIFAEGEDLVVQA